MTRSTALRCVALAALVALPALARAQGSGSGTAGASAADDGMLTMRAARRDTVRASTTVSGAFTVSNYHTDSVEVRPRVELPADWTVLTGGVPFVVGPQSAEMLILSVVVPSRAPAGVYPLRVWLTSARNPRGIMDSILVAVVPRRGFDVLLADRPGYVVSGRAYETTFAIRNRGNVASQLRLGTRSTLSVVTLSDSVLTLAPNEERIVRANALTKSGLASATDDVIEIFVREMGAGPAGAPAAEPIATGSARTAVVPEPARRIDEFQRLPTRVNLRAASSDGVSPFEVIGSGPVIDGGSLDLDFLFRGPTGPYSAFGERDEYRVSLSTPSWRARFGDQLFMLSTLTGSGQPGFGVGADGTRGRYSAGGYAQQFRRSFDKGSEVGAFASVVPIDNSELALNLVSRSGDQGGTVGSVRGVLDRPLYGGVLEVARSANDSGAGGFAHAARVHLGAANAALDLGHRGGDSSFAGSQRGARHAYVAGHLRASDALSLNLNASSQRTDLSRSTGVPYLERFDIGSLSATLFETYMLELGGVARGATVSGIASEASEVSLRGRTDYFFPVGMITLDAEGGRAEHATGRALFAEGSVAFRQSRDFGTWGAYVERYSGGGVMKGPQPATTIGADASVHLNRATWLSLMGYGTRAHDAGAQWHSQLDAQVTRTLRNGSTISLRTRLMGGGVLSGSDRMVAYLEYGMPFALPVSRLRTTGRVQGRVVDAVSGQGVANALVRLGPQIAITDRSGRVAFGGVPGGEHRLSLSQETSFANAVFVGEPTIQVDSLRQQPTEFTLAIARSAQVNIDVRRFTVARTGVGGAPDSLADAGALANATVILVSGRDTLYRTTGASGRATFRDIPPGDWSVAMRWDAPAHHRFDPERLEITLAPGEVKDLSFKLVPRRREVQIIGAEEELKAIQAEQKTSAPAPGARVIKPNERIKHDHKN